MQPTAKNPDVTHASKDQQSTEPQEAQGRESEVRKKETENNTYRLIEKLKPPPEVTKSGRPKSTRIKKPAKVENKAQPK